MVPISSLFKSSLKPQSFSDDLDRFIKITSSQDIMESPKINGVRCWSIINKDSINYYSKNGKEFFNFDIFDNSIRTLADEIILKHQLSYPIIFDSEVASKSQRLSDIMTQLRRLNNMNPNTFQMHIFDIAINNIPFKKRHDIVKSVLMNKKFNNIFLLPYNDFQFSQINLHNLINKYVSKGYEGTVLMYSKAPYIFGKETKYGCKVKKLNTIDLKIIDIELGKSGTRLEGKLATFICDFKGQKIKLSGRLTDKMRVEYAKNPPIGSYIEVKYKSITSSGKLEHPIFVRVREDK